jgi:hypothetical protein
MLYQYIPYPIFRIVNFGLEQFFTSINYFYFATFLKWLKYRLLSYISNALPHKEYDDEIAKFIYLGSGVRWPAAARI